MEHFYSFKCISLVYPITGRSVEVAVKEVAICRMALQKREPATISLLQEDAGLPDCVRKCISTFSETLWKARKISSLVASKYRTGYSGMMEKTTPG